MSEVVYGGADSLELDALAVYSHPDDAELTCAGTLLKLKSLGRRTGVVAVARGEVGTSGTTGAAASIIPRGWRSPPAARARPASCRRPPRPAASGSGGTPASRRSSR